MDPCVEEGILEEKEELYPKYKKEREKRRWMRTERKVRTGVKGQGKTIETGIRLSRIYKWKTTKKLPRSRPWPDCHSSQRVSWSVWDEGLKKTNKMGI